MRPRDRPWEMPLMEEDDESESPGLPRAVISFPRRVSSDRHAGGEREREMSNAYLSGMAEEIDVSGPRGLV